LWIDLAERMMLQEHIVHWHTVCLSGLLGMLLINLFPDAIAGKPYCVVLRLSVDMTRNWDGITTAVSRRLKTTIACIYCLGCPAWHTRSHLLYQLKIGAIRLAHIVEAQRLCVRFLNCPGRQHLVLFSARCCQWVGVVQSMDDENHFQLEDGIIPVVKK